MTTTNFSIHSIIRETLRNGTKDNINKTPDVLSFILMKKQTRNTQEVDSRDGLRWVIDADRQVKLRQFNVNNTDKEIKYYESLGKWNDISTDSDGDIILWKE